MEFQRIKLKLQIYILEDLAQLFTYLPEVDYLSAVARYSRPKSKKCAKHESSNNSRKTQRIAAKMRYVVGDRWAEVPRKF